MNNKSKNDYLENNIIKIIKNILLKYLFKIKHQTPQINQFN